MTERPPPDPLTSSPGFLAEADRLSRSVLAAEHPDEPASALHGLAMVATSAAPPVGSWAHATWLIWGSLTDGLDGPRSDDRTAAWAVDGMRRAAAEWLALDRSDHAAVDRYLDRWVYEECGYPRPPAPAPAPAEPSEL